MSEVKSEDTDALFRRVCKAEENYRAIVAVAEDHANRGVLRDVLFFYPSDNVPVAVRAMLEQVVAEQLDAIIEQAVLNAATDWHAARSAALARLQEPIPGFDAKEP